MEKRGARLFQVGNDVAEVQRMRTTDTAAWNIVELESHRSLRTTIHDLMDAVLYSSMTRRELQQQLQLNRDRFGSRLTRQLVRSLHRDAPHEREALVLLVTILHDPEALPLLRHMSHNKLLPRQVRLSASFALAGMGETQEMIAEPTRIHLFAMS